MNDAAFVRAAAQEAIDTLGLLRPAALSTIISMLAKSSIEHPRVVCTAYRKAGKQLSRDEKRALGLRANAFLSHEALAEISDVGISGPFSAHEVTLLRASFSQFRRRSIAHAEALDFDAYQSLVKYDAITLDCPECKAIDGVIVPLSEAAILPSPGHSCTTANYSIGPHIDWLAGID